MKIRKMIGPNGSLYHEFLCPGCGYVHCLRTRGIKGPIWKFNGDPHKPTFEPSIKSSYNSFEDTEGHTVKAFCCHSIVTDGRIQFLDDCTHEMRGKTVDLPDLKKGIGR